MIDEVDITPRRFRPTRAISVWEVTPDNIRELAYEFSMDVEYGPSAKGPQQPLGIRYGGEKVCRIGEYLCTSQGLWFKKTRGTMKHEYEEIPSDD